jgi:hypothetical protein
LRSDIVKTGDKEFADNSKWDNIFKLKGEAAEEAGKNVTVKFAEGKCFCNEIGKYKKGVDLDSLDALGKLVEDLKDKKVKIDDSKAFSLAFGSKHFKVCDCKEIDIESDSNFETLLKYVATLKNVSAIQDDFKIKIEVATNDIKLNDGVVDQEFVKKQNFWKAVKAHKELFDGLPVAVGQEETGSSKKGKIGDTVIEVEMFDGTDIAQEWIDVFTNKEDKK